MPGWCDEVTTTPRWIIFRTEVFHSSSVSRILITEMNTDSVKRCRIPRSPVRSWRRSCSPIPLQFTCVKHAYYYSLVYQHTLRPHTHLHLWFQTQVVFCLKKKPPHKLKCRTDCLIQQRFDIYKKKKKKTIHLVLFNAVEHPQNEWAPAVTYIRAAVNRCQLCLSILSNLNKNI